jgi:hypothetical protein
VVSLRGRLHLLSLALAELKRQVILLVVNLAGEVAGDAPFLETNFMGYCFNPRPSLENSGAVQLTY